MGEGIEWGRDRMGGGELEECLFATAACCAISSKKEKENGESKIEDNEGKARGRRAKSAKRAGTRGMQAR